MSTLAQVTGTGDVITGVHRLHSIVLTPAAAIATVAIRDGAGGPILATLQAPASGGSVVWTLAERGVQFATAIHLTLTGAGAIAVVDYS